MTFLIRFLKLSRVLFVVGFDSNDFLMKLNETSERQNEKDVENKLVGDFCWSQWYKQIHEKKEKTNEMYGR